jgi:predicted nucleic acid-binding protein
VNTTPVFLDVNVPMYAAGKPHAFKEACVWLLTQIANGVIVTAIDTEIIQEILYRYGALQEWKVATTMATNLLELVPVVYPVTPDDIKLTILLFQQYGPKGVRARDLIHVAVMRNHGLTQIISTDAHFDLIPGLMRLDPMQLYAKRQ